MNWIKIDSIDKLNELKEFSIDNNILIFKYSPNCAVNYVVRNLLEREWNEGEMNMKTYLLDVISDKQISKLIESEFGIKHESPQVLILNKSKLLYSASHGKVLFSEIRKFAN